MSVYIYIYTCMYVHIHMSYTYLHMHKHAIHVESAPPQRAIRGRACDRGRSMKPMASSLVAVSCGGSGSPRIARPRLRAEQAMKRCVCIYIYMFCCTYVGMHAYVCVYIPRHHTCIHICIRIYI